MLVLALAMVSLDSEQMLGLVVLLALGLYSLVLLLNRLTSGPRQPDPWDAETAARLEDAETPIMCHKCLVPNKPEADFCENCGATVGKYTNYLPFPYVFSLGHTLRLGTAGDYKRSPITVLGFVLLALAEYTVFAPIYIFQLFRHRPIEVAEATPPPPAAS
jgi:hypothetical protein